MEGEAVAPVENGTGGVVKGGAPVLEKERTEGGALGREKECTMVEGGASTSGAPGGRATVGKGGRSSSAAGGSSHALKRVGIFGNWTSYFSSRYPPIPSNSSLTDGKDSMST